jgi:hypothetical protein
MQELDDEETLETVEATSASPTEPAYHTAPNTPDNTPDKSELMQLSAHAIEGTTDPATAHTPNWELASSSTSGQW